MELYKFVRFFFLPLLGSVFIWVLAIVTVILFWPYRYLVDRYLKFKYSRQYGGLMENADILYLMNNPSMTTINSSLLVAKSRTKRDFVSDIRKVFEQKVFNGTDDYLKLTSSVQNFSGYFFLKKDDLIIEDVLVPMEKPKDEPYDMSYMEKYLGNISGGDFARKGDGSALWDLHVSKEPMDGPDDEFHRYPMIVRFHHGMCDGTSLIALMIRLLGDDSCQNYCDELFNKIKSNKRTESMEKSLRNVMKAYWKVFIQYTKFWLDAIFLALGRYGIICFCVRADKSSLHGPKHTGKKYVAFAVEQTPECVPIIKQMRKRMPDTRFTNVIGTAIAASFVKFFKRNNQSIPEHATGLITMLLEFPKIELSKPIALKNKATACLFHTPLTYGSKSLPESFKDVSEAMNSQIRYEEAVMCRLVTGNLAGIIPINSFRYLFGMANNTFLLTNIPGGSTMSFLNGCILEYLIPVAPNINGIGVSLALLTYDDRFHIGVMVDQGLISSQKEVKMLAEDILVAIKDLDAQTKKMHCD